MKKLFTLALLFVISLSLSSQNRLFVQDKETNKMYEVRTNKKFRYTLLSDSTLELGYANIERDKIQWVNEDKIFLSSGEEIDFSDIGTLYRFSKLHQAMRNLSVPFLTIGVPLFLHGTTKLSLEGLERNNKDYVPVATGAGTFFSLLGILPYAIGPKSFDITQDRYELIVM